jgi:hypothetical protein
MRLARTYPSAAAHVLLGRYHVSYHSALLPSSLGTCWVHTGADGNRIRDMLLCDHADYVSGMRLSGGSYNQSHPDKEPDPKTS